MRLALRSLLLLAAAAAPLAAQSTRADLLVSPQWLAQHVRDPNLVILQVGMKESYDKAHIPGSRFADGFTASQDATTNLSYELPAADSLRAILARLGISDNSRIVVAYSDRMMPHATRLVLTLDQAGLGAATSLLDGGVAGWTAAGNAATADATPERLGTLSPLKTRPVIVTADFVRDHLGKPGYTVVDGRAAAFYEGVSEGGPEGFRKKGHVAGATSIPYNQLNSTTGELKSAEELGAMFAKAGVKKGDTVIGYCHIGMQATAMLFAARTLGYNVLLFDGSFEDWARRGLPVAVPPGK